MAEEVRYLWQQQLLDAFLSPRRELPQKIAIAERAIAERLQDSGELDFAEHAALRDARRALRVLLSEAEREFRQLGQRAG
jgi:hypothetical protein